MRLSEYIKTTAKHFAQQHDIPLPVITRFLNGNRGLSAQTMAKIVAATGGQVTYEDLIAEMQERQAARKKRKGNGQAEEIVPPGI